MLTHKHIWLYTSNNKETLLQYVSLSKILISLRNFTYLHKGDFYIWPFGNSFGILCIFFFTTIKFIVIALILYEETAISYKCSSTLVQILLEIALFFKLFKGLGEMTIIISTINAYVYIIPRYFSNSIDRKSVWW